MDTHQAAYTTQRRDAMVSRVDEELRLAENKKRSREVPDEFLDTYKRAKMDQPNTMVPVLEHGNSSSEASLHS